MHWQNEWLSPNSPGLFGLQPAGKRQEVRVNNVEMVYCITYYMIKVTYLKKIDVSIGIAEAEDILFLGMLRNCLHNTVLSKHCIMWCAFLLWGGLSIGFTQQKCTAYRRQENNLR